MSEEHEHDEQIFPQEGFPSGGDEAPAVPEADASEQEALPWLELTEKYPRFDPAAISDELREAVLGGERPAEAYLRIENERLERNLKLLRIEQRLRETAIGSARSSRAEAPSDPFLEGLSFMR